MRVSSNFSGRTELDEVSSSVTYVGKAPHGASSSSPTWLICKITTTGSDISIQYASPYFNQVWDDRASLLY